MALITLADIDECEQDTNNCNENAECDNRVGSFLCTCEEDYTGNGIDCELRGKHAELCTKHCRGRPGLEYQNGYLGLHIYMYLPPNY